jgi:integrase/recombinase XerD
LSRFLFHLYFTNQEIFHLIMGKESKLSIKFYLNKDKGKGDLYPVYCRIIINLTKAEICTEFKLMVTQWSEAKQEAINNDIINASIHSLKSELYGIKRDLEKTDQPISASVIKKIYSGDDQAVPAICRYFETYIHKIRTKAELADVTVKKYDRTLEKLKQFIKVQYSANDINVDKINYSFLDTWDTYLISSKANKKETTLHRNTVNNYHDCLCAVIGSAFREGKIKRTPYDSYSYKDEYQSKTPLSYEQLKAIMDLDLNQFPRLDKVRDIFIFSCFTGLRFSDVIGLDAASVTKDSNGLFFLLRKQKKTGRVIPINLFEPALKIYNKYDADERKITGKMLPQMSNQKFNAYLKEISDLAKLHLEAPLTHHLSRHTFATTVCAENGISNEVIGIWIDHKKESTTKIYTKHNNPYIKNIGKELSENINKKFYETN